MARTWFLSDPHLGHQGILRFKRKDGSPLRDFQTIEEHDDAIINNCNLVVKPEDKMYVMGDVAMSKKNIATVGRINCRKTLLMGNHDIYNSDVYLKYFDNIRAYKIYPEQGIIFSHIPVSPGQLENRFKWNCHGHLHANFVEEKFKAQIGEPIIKKEGGWYDEDGNYGWPDKRYINLCVEHTNYAPVSFEEICQRIGWINPQGAIS